MVKENDFYLASNIKHLRLSHKETQEDLAEVIGKGFTAIGNYEKGIRNPDYMDLYEIAKHYNVSIDDLIKKDLKIGYDIQLDENHKLDSIIMDKSKELTDEDKEKLINVIDTIFDK